MTPRVRPGGLRELGPAAYAFSRAAGRVMGTAPPAVFTVLGRARRTYWGWLGFAASLMPFGHLPRRESELVILRVAHLRDSAYERAHHERIGRRSGLTTSEIDRTATDLDDQWPARDAAILRAVDELVGTSDLSDETWTALGRHLDERERLELLLLVGNYTMLATTLHVLRLQPDPPRARNGDDRPAARVERSVVADERGAAPARSDHSAGGSSQALGPT